MAINDWPAHQRPREKLLQLGAGALTDAELLAIFLRTGVKGASAVELAERLLQHFGGLRALLVSERQTACQVNGFGAAKYAQLQAALEMGRRYLTEELTSRPVFNHPDQVAAFLTAELGCEQREVFGCLFLDSRHQLLGFERLFLGTINAATVYPREVVKRSLAHNAAAVILAHNHPSGVAEPSASDVAITKRLQEALALVEVRVLDHLVVGAGAPISLASRGLITSIELS